VYVNKGEREGEIERKRRIEEQGSVRYYKQRRARRKRAGRQQVGGGGEVGIQRIPPTAPRVRDGSEEGMPEKERHQGSIEKRIRRAL
jgi:hypothetical protein